VVQVTGPVLEALSPVSTPSGIVAIGRVREARLEQLTHPAPGLVVATLDVQDPGNVGAVIRSADAFGATGVACLGTSADPLGWKALRGSMGSALRVPVRRELDALGTIHALRAFGLTAVVAGAHGGVDADALDWRRPTLLIMGSEGSGVPEHALAAADQVVCIPMRDGVESLNVAVAAGVILSRASAQRRSAGRR
jgi:TrmH family RNA methyltransferase